MRVGLLQNLVMAALIAFAVDSLVPGSWNRLYVIGGAVFLGELLEFSIGPWRNRRFY